MAESLRGEFQLLAEPIEITPQDADIAPNQGYFESERELFIGELTDDARWIFSGMIYGYVVTWVPPFNARGVEEELRIEPITHIPAKDERLKMLSINKIDGVVYVLMEYTGDFTQQKRLEAWRNPFFPSSAGEGGSPFSGGSRREALEMAIKEAIENHFTKKEFNRPKGIQVKVALADFPLIGLDNGAYRALVSIKVGPSSVRHYRID